MASTKKASKTITDTGVDIQFESGQQVSVQLTLLPDDILHRLALHGLSQKLGDSYAGAEPDEAYELAQVVADRLMAGEWTQARSSTGPGTARASMLVEALASATGKDIEQALAVVFGMDEDQRKALKKHPAIAAELARLTAERAVAKAKKAQAAVADGGTLDLSSI